MTVHARGYRPYDGPRVRFGLRFAPIFVEGYRNANRSVVLLIFRILFILIPFVLLTFALYTGSGPLKELLRRQPGAAGSEEEAARRALVGILLLYHQWTSLFIMFLAIFSGAGLIADDLRTRALPLYLVRPLTPLDYFLGKWLVPVTILAVHVLLPGLLLMLFAGFLRPSGETFSFLAAQLDIVVALLSHFAVLATGYTSLVLLISTCARRRLTAIILSALAFLGGGVLSAAGQSVSGPLGDAARACSLYQDAYVVLRNGLGSGLPWMEANSLPSSTAALVVPGALLLACAILVLRRARTTEVVS